MNFIKMINNHSSRWQRRQYGYYIWKMLRPCIKLVVVKDYEIQTHFCYSSFASMLIFFRKHTYCQYDQLLDMVVVDSIGHKYRFSIHYILFSTRFQNQLRVIVQLDEPTPIASLQEIYVNSNWLEREVWDLYGVYFVKHNDLRRILTDYGFLGHPLRKDFPLTGFDELYYHESQKKIIYDRVMLTQEFRTYTVKRSWIE
jgi:NADH:ubiquinone oxidoreductase subunit C